MVEEKENLKIDLISPIKIFLSKENWRNSLWIWLIIFFIVGTIKPILKLNNQTILDIIISISLSILVFSYFLLYLHNVLNNKINILPEFNFKKMITITFDLSIIILPLIFIEGLLIFIYLSLHLSSSGLFKFPILLLAISAVLALTFIIINIYMIFIECTYLKNFEIKEGFGYFKIWELFKIGWIAIIKTYFQSFIIIVPFSCLYLILVFCVKDVYILTTINLVFILSSIYYSLIFNTVKINLIGQVYNNTLVKFKNSSIGKKTEKIIILIALTVLILLLISISNYEMLMIKSGKLNVGDLINLSNFSKTVNLNDYSIFIFQKLLRYTTDYLLGF